MLTPTFNCVGGVTSDSEKVELIGYLFAQTR